MANYVYGTTPAGPDMLGTAADILSLAFILASVLVLTYLVLKVRTRKSFQFEMFLFALILGSGEVPYALYNLIGLNLGVLVTYGLEVHTVSMIILAAYVAYRIYGFFKGSTLAAA